MKIGILTLVPYDNYGGILQGFALQTVLSRLGHDVSVMNTKLYNYLPVKSKLKNSVLWLIRRYILRKKELVDTSPQPSPQGEGELDQKGQNKGKQNGFIYRQHTIINSDSTKGRS